MTALASQLCHYIEDHVFPNAGSAGVSMAQLEVVNFLLNAGSGTTPILPTNL